MMLENLGCAGVRGRGGGCQKPSVSLHVKSLLGIMLKDKTRCRGARIAFCTSCCLSARSLTFTVEDNKCAGFVFSIDWKQRGCGGYAEALLSVLWGWLEQWLSALLNFPWSLEYPGVLCKKVNYQINSSFLGLFRGRSGLWNGQAFIEGWCVLMKGKGVRQKVC